MSVQLCTWQHCVVYLCHVCECAHTHDNRLTPTLMNSLKEMELSPFVSASCMVLSAMLPSCSSEMFTPTIIRKTCKTWMKVPSRLMSTREKHVPGKIKWRRTALCCFALNKSFVWVIQPRAHSNYRSHTAGETEMASQTADKSHRGKQNRGR